MLAELTGPQGPFRDFVVKVDDGSFGTDYAVHGVVDLTGGPAAFGDQELSALARRGSLRRHADGGRARRGTAGVRHGRFPGEREPARQGLADRVHAELHRRATQRRSRPAVRNAATPPPSRSGDCCRWLPLSAWWSCVRDSSESTASTAQVVGEPRPVSRERRRLSRYMAHSKLQLGSAPSSYSQPPCQNRSTVRRRWCPRCGTRAGSRATRPGRRCRSGGPARVGRTHQFGTASEPSRPVEADHEFAVGGTELTSVVHQLARPSEVVTAS